MSLEICHQERQDADSRAGRGAAAAESDQPQRQFRLRDRVLLAVMVSFARASTRRLDECRGSLAAGKTPVWRVHENADGSDLR